MQLTFFLIIFISAISSLVIINIIDIVVVINIITITATISSSQSSSSSRTVTKLLLLLLLLVLLLIISQSISDGKIGEMSYFKKKDPKIFFLEKGSMLYSLFDFPSHFLCGSYHQYCQWNFIIALNVFAIVTFCKD